MGPLNALDLPPDPHEGVWLRQQVALPGQARRAAAQFARRAALGADRISEIELAVTEVAVNLNRHAEDGSLLLRLLRTAAGPTVELLAIDHGPGIADLATARRDGYSSAGTLGVGLGVVQRMADTFDVQSLMGRGTVLLARFQDRADAPYPEPAVVGLTRPLSGETVCGDAWAVRTVGEPAEAEPAGEESDPGAEQLLVVLCDGLGHGPLAARASAHAVTAFRRAAATEPTEIVRALHSAMAGTRGGALGVARIDLRTRRVSYCGVGNISAFIVTDLGRSSLLSAPGIVGHHLPRLRGFEADLPAGASLVLHSDGLTERWDPSSMAGLLRHPGTVIAAQLLREAGVRRDDAGVVVVKTAEAAPGGRP
ncbi:ATP-binding protein [Actinospica robiniae]|uniref:ATP-binding protein n=1 Tax=Actinospica robiniae TaxID=304901 RepID=UPI0003FC40A5|nr:ATP-binding protein [Actinospica robiniae]